MFKYIVPQRMDKERKMSRWNKKNVCDKIDECVGKVREKKYGSEPKQWMPKYVLLKSYAFKKYAR